MTCYHGGKQRIGKQLAQQIYKTVKNLNFPIKGYCEPFCGMLGVYRYIPDLFQNDFANIIYKAGDINESVVKMWQEAQKGWKPPCVVTQSEFNFIKNQNGSSAIKGYVGHQYCYGGQYFQGYSPKYGKSDDSSKTSNNISNIATRLKQIEFKAGSYTEFSHLQGYIIYCDPPYQNTACRYYDDDGKKRIFDTENFWQWCRKMAENNIVFVSSYCAPQDFQCVYSSSHQLTGSSINTRKRTENLYTY